MTSDIERWCFPRETERIVESVTIRHQGSGSHHTLAMRLDDAGVHIGRKSKIVGVDDQTPIYSQMLRLRNIRNHTGLEQA